MPVHSDARPLCFVLMPFGDKKDANNKTILFDDVYLNYIRPAIEDAELHPIRADEEKVGGIIHKPMFERLLLCDFAIADLTTANANVFYELGVRHAARPFSTVLIAAKGSRLPFDIRPLRVLHYEIDDTGRPGDPDTDREALVKALRQAKEDVATRTNVDSPLFQLVQGYRAPDISRLKTDVFREHVEYEERIKRQLTKARNTGVNELQAVETQLGNLDNLEAGVLVDLLLSYRAVESWESMIELVEKLPAPIAQATMVQEQYGLALNRAGRGDEAERVLKRLIDDHGPSSETYGILGRIYKDRWQAAKAAGRAVKAKGFLNQAIETYLRGFQSDWRDAFPGINAVTLMASKEPPDPRQKDLLPVVTYAVRRRIEDGEPDYWDQATLLELAVLAGDPDTAVQALSNALAIVDEAFKPETTANNLRMIRETREARGERADWIAEIEAELAETADELRT